MAFIKGIRGKGKGTFYTQEEKIEVVTHFLSCGSQKETQFKFGVAPSTLHKWKAKYEQYITGASQESIVKKQAEIANIKLEYSKDVTMTGILEIQKLAIDRIKALLPAEEDLNKILKAFEITLKVTNPEKEGDDKSVNTYNIIELVNKQITNNGASKG